MASASLAGGCTAERDLGARRGRRSWLEVVDKTRATGAASPFTHARLDIEVDEVFPGAGDGIGRLDARGS
jgi:hypothetical protein